jgi:crotonobetainyl-CoA:carnitine CoA-transferase CaiB-like acyl-CoA transferase
VAAERVQRVIDLFHDPQLQAREFFVTLDHPDTGPYAYTGPPVRYGAESGSVGRPAPTVGEHYEWTLVLLGVSPSELAELARSQVIGDEPLEDDQRRG